MIHKVNVEYEVEYIKLKIKWLEIKKQELLDDIDVLRMLQDLHNLMAHYGLFIKAGPNCTYAWDWYDTKEGVPLPRWGILVHYGERILAKYNAKIISTIETDWMVTDDYDEIPVEYKALTIKTESTQTDEFRYKITCDGIKDYIHELIERQKNET